MKFIIWQETKINFQLVIIINILKMLPSKLTNKLDGSVYKRRLSLNEKLYSTHLNTQRQQFKQRYHQFVQSRRKYMENSPCSPETQDIDECYQLQKSMPSLRMIRQQKTNIGEALRKTISKYNYENQQKIKKLQILNRKKIKYEKILKIRQQNHRQKMQLNESRLSKLQQYSNEKLKLKKSVDQDKIIMGQSRIKILNEKKSLGMERRQQLNFNKFLIQTNKTKSLEVNKRLHQSISIQQKQLKVYKNEYQKQIMKVNQQRILTKLSKQMDQVCKLQKKSSRDMNKFQNQIHELEKSNKLLDEQLKMYNKKMIDGSTLRKQKQLFKIQIASQKTSKRSKTEYVQQDSFY